MEMLSLNGSWSVSRADEDDWFEAAVPGCVHTDLLAAGRIDDPYYRENELDLQWIGEADWVYRRSFTVPAAMLACPRVVLRCGSLDTFARVSINGTEIGRADNMFRQWDFDAKAALVAGENTIEVRLDSVKPYLREKEAQRHLGTPKCIGHEEPGRPWVRKEQCNFGWDWGPVLVTCGIRRDIELLAFGGGKIEHHHIRQDHRDDGSVALTIAATLDQAAGEGEILRATVRFDGETIASAESGFEGEKAAAEIVLESPKLWWPAGMGDQPLYDVALDYVCASGKVKQSIGARVGLRTLELVREKDAWGESFYFRANGVPYFAKGSDWIPADALHRTTDAQYRGLLESAVAANQNMIRVWGGGFFEEDIFYDLCDELGLTVWQDFMFACSAYPADDPAFMANVKAEIACNVRRLRNHPCLALWCGNNELEMNQARLPENTWPYMPLELYVELFDRVIPSIVRAEDPDRPYWPCSPHNPTGDRRDHSNQESGNGHLWNVWHGMQPFEWYRTAYHRFCSEFGFQSYPEPRTVESYTLPGDRNITSPVMEFHQRSRDGNPKIMQYMLSWYRMPSSYEGCLWLSQLQQGLAMKYAVEHWRRNMPRCMGALYWQLNDCWPVASWSSIDYFGRWKALHYMARRFYNPLLVSGVEDPEAETVEIHLTSDLGEAKALTVRWTLTDVVGRTLDSGEAAVESPVRGSNLIRTLDCSAALEQVGPRDLLVWLELLDGDEPVSGDFVTFVRPKALELQDPELSVAVSADDDSGLNYTVTLEAVRPALWAWVTLGRTDARLSDNFLCLRPGRSYSLTMTLAEARTLEEVREQIKASSIYDLV